MTAPRLRVLVASGRRWDAASLQLALAARALAARDAQVRVATPADADAHWQTLMPEIPVTPFPDSTRRRRETLSSLIGAMRANVVLTDDDGMRRRAARAIGDTGCVLQRLVFGADVPAETFLSRLAARRSPSALLVPQFDDTRFEAGGKRRVPLYAIPLVTAIADDEPRAASRETPVLLVVPDADAPLDALPVLRAAAQVARRHDTLRVHVLGAPRTTQGLRVQAAALRMAAHVTTGPLLPGQVDVPAGTIAAWITAGGETGVAVALAAMARRVPVLLPTVSELAPAVADRITGVLLDAADPLADAIAAGHIARLIGHDDEQRSMGAAARARMQRLHDEHGLADAVIDGVERLLAGTRRAA